MVLGHGFRTWFQVKQDILIDTRDQFDLRHELNDTQIILVSYLYANRGQIPCAKNS